MNIGKNRDFPLNFSHQADDNAGDSAILCVDRLVIRIRGFKTNPNRFPIKSFYGRVFIIDNGCDDFAVLSGLRPFANDVIAIKYAAAERIHPNDEKRIIRALEVYELTGKPISDFQQQFSAQPKDDWLVIGLQREKTDASHRINERVKKLFELGLIDEVKSLLAEEKPLSMQARCAIGYAETIAHLEGKETLEKTIENIKVNTRRFAKAQRTWFKTFRFVNWLNVGENDTTEQVLDRAISY